MYIYILLYIYIYVYIYMRRENEGLAQYPWHQNGECSIPPTITSLICKPVEICREKGKYLMQARLVLPRRETIMEDGAVQAYGTDGERIEYIDGENRVRNSSSHLSIPSSGKEMSALCNDVSLTLTIAPRPPTNAFHLPSVRKKGIV